MSGFSFFQDNLITAGAFSALAGALAVGFITRRLAWVLASLAIACGLVANIVTPLGLACLVATGFVTYFSYKNNTRLALQVASFVGACVLAALAMMHLLPGFHNLKVLDKIALSGGAAPYSMYLNFDKPFVAFLILGLGGPVAIEEARPRRYLEAGAWALGAVLCAVLVGMGTGFVHFEPKWPDAGWIWLLNNMFLVCIVEELIFRRFVLGKVLAFTSKYSRFSTPIAIAISSVLFGAAHLRDGALFAGMAAILGLLYALAYVRSKTIAAPILAHMAVNLTHFILFTYPFVAKV